METRHKRGQTTRPIYGRKLRPPKRRFIEEATASPSGTATEPRTNTTNISAHEQSHTSLPNNGHNQANRHEPRSTAGRGIWVNKSLPKKLSPQANAANVHRPVLLSHNHGQCRTTPRINVNTITANQPCRTSVQEEPDFPAPTFTLNTRSYSLFATAPYRCPGGH